MFYGCDFNGSIPAKLFANNPKLKNLAYAFYSLNTLEGAIPEGLFDNNPALDDVEMMFNGCTNLTTLPTNLFVNNPNIKDFHQIFENCYKLVGTAPDLWVTHPDANGTKCFRNCSKLTNYADIPDDWK